MGPPTRWALDGGGQGVARLTSLDVGSSDVSLGVLQAVFVVEGALQLVRGELAACSPITMIITPSKQVKWGRDLFPLLKAETQFSHDRMSAVIITELSLVSDRGRDVVVEQEG